MEKCTYSWTLIFKALAIIQKAKLLFKDKGYLSLLYAGLYTRQFLKLVPLNIIYISDLHMVWQKQLIIILGHTKSEPDLCLYTRNL